MRFVMLATLFLASGSAAADPARRIDAPVAIQLYSFHEQLEVNPEPTLAKIRRLGFRCVESYSLPGRTVPEVALMLKKNGLKAVAAHVSAIELRDNLPKVAAARRRCKQAPLPFPGRGSALALSLA